MRALDCGIEMRPVDGIAIRIAELEAAAILAHLSAIHAEGLLLAEPVSHIEAACARG